MSNYKLAAVRRTTNIEVIVDALDDFFANHQYGYSVDDRILTEAEFHREYEPLAELSYPQM